MTFTIHITHRHIEGAGLHNEYYERIEPCDEDIEIEIADEEVHRDVVEMIYRDYFHEALVPLDEFEYYANVVDRIKLMIKAFIDDFDMWDAIVETLYDELRDKYEEEYDND